MSYIVHDAPQGSPDWFLARSGAITASMFATVRAKVGGLTEQQAKYVEAIRSGKTEAQARDVAGYKAAPKADVVQRALDGEKVGDWSQAAQDYAFRLAVERISGEPLDEGFETWAMRRGHELEPEARMEHESRTGLFVETAGFVTTEDGAFGASADGFVQPDEGCEYKCFIAPEKLRAFWFENDASSVMDQVQGGMWITGRKRWHLGMYCPALKAANKHLWLHTYERDDDYIEALEADLLEFKGLVDQYENRLRTEAM